MNQLQCSRGTESQIFAARCRKGFSRLDLVGVLVITFILLAAIPAWISSSRVSASKLRCLSHLRQLAISVINVSSNRNQERPPLVDSIEISNELGQTGMLQKNLMMALLPALDCAAFARELEQKAVFSPSKDDPSRMILAEASKISFDVFVCPADLEAVKTQGRTSYIANIGFLSQDLFQGDPDGLHQLGRLTWGETDTANPLRDREISDATGVFWRRNPNVAQSWEDIATGDGQTSTLMLTENRQAGTWYDTDTARIGFGLPIAVKQQQVLFGTGTSLESQEQPLNTEFQGSTLLTQFSPEWRINRGVSPTTAMKARPSSPHAGAVNAMFCDGSGKILSDAINPQVYVKLLTSNGVTFGERQFDQRAF